MTDELKGCKLLPCPFCGGDGANVIGEEPHFYVACGNPDCYAAVGEIWDRDAMPDHAFFAKGVAIAAWNARPSPATDSNERLLMGSDITTKDAAEILEQILLEYKVDPVLKEQGYKALSRLKKSATKHEPATDDALREALEIFTNAVDGDGWVYHPGKSPIHQNGFPIMTPEQFRIIYTALKGKSK